MLHDLLFLMNLAGAIGFGVLAFVFLSVAFHVPAFGPIAFLFGVAALWAVVWYLKGIRDLWRGD